MAAKMHFSIRSIWLRGLLPIISICVLSVGTVSMLNAQRRDPSESSNRRAMAYYSDAASFQNNAAYPLAIEEWEKLLREFPTDPLAGKAWHYLGVCYIQTKSYPKAIRAFRESLKHSEPEVREESLINLSWCLFTTARLEKPNSSAQNAGLRDAKKSLTEFLKSYADGNYVDQALFYLGEIEYSLGSADTSIAYYKKLITDKKYEKSKFIPDARYAIAVAYEEQEQLSLARRQYEEFLQRNRDHRLVDEVRVRLSDILISTNKPAEAAKLLRDSIADNSKSSVADYSLLRLAYALSQQGQNTQAKSYYEQLLRKYPDSKHATPAALSLGQLLYQEGKYSDAVRVFKKLLAAKDEPAAEAAHWIAISQLREGKAEETRKLLAGVLGWADSTPSATNLQMDYADALYALPNELEAAQKAYERIATDSPDESLAPRAAYNAAFAALQRGKLSVARSWAERFLGKYPQHALRGDVSYVAAEALLQQGEHKAAAQAYAKLRKSDPGNPTYLAWTLRQAMAHYLAGEYSSATKILDDKSVRFEEKSQQAEALFIQGASRLYQQDIDGAIEQLAASHRTSQQWESADEVLLLLAEAQQRNNDNTAAQKTLRMLIEKYPQTRLKSQVEYKLAQLSAALENYDEAISAYQAITKNSEAKSYHNFANYGIAWCLMQQERFQPALAALQPVLRSGVSDSISSEAKLAEGVCLRKLGRANQAVQSLTAFLDTKPSGKSLGNGLYELGLAHTELGELEKATRHFNKILAEVPNYPAIDKVLYELAWNHEEEAKHETASKYFQQLVQKYPESEYSAEATYMLAQKSYEDEDYAAAAAAYENVLTRAKSIDLIEKTLYKLGWSHFQQERYDLAAVEFKKQIKSAPKGALAVDAQFMNAECSFNQDQFGDALKGYIAARDLLENSPGSAASDQVRTLVYLHGAQCYREQKRWDECEKWLNMVVDKYSDSPYIATAIYELGYCKQNLKDIEGALAAYGQVANDYRNETAARARFMMGEVYFSQRDFAKAIRQFQRVMYGFGGDKAPSTIKNWQAKSAYEAARCSEVLIQNLGGNSRDEIIKTAQEYYNFIVEKHARHDLAAQAQSRLGELRKLR